MKTYKLKIAILLSLCWLFMSCSDFLDRTPDDQISSGTAFLSISDAELSVNGFYSTIKTEEYYGGNLPAMGDLRGGDIRPKATSGWYNVYIFNFDPTNSSYGALWSTCYNVIMRANTFLAGWESIPASSAGDISKKNDFKGQALAISAFCHFDIIRLYCYPYLMPNAPTSLGPIIADRVIAPYEEVPRATLEQGYTYVIDLLTEALTLLSKDKNTGHINYWAAKALLARVYLYKGDYDNAFKHADELINDNSCPYNLVANNKYIDYWEEQGEEETLLEIFVTTQSNINTNGGVYGWFDNLWHGDAGAAKRAVPSDDWLSLMEVDGAADVRYGFIQVDGSTKWINKFPGTDGENYKINNPRLIRLAEVYLIAAEAALKKSSTDQSKADSYLDAIKRRANPTVAAITATEDLIIVERRKELIGEGHRYFDMARLGKTIDRTSSDHVVTSLLPIDYQTVNTWDATKLIVLPISASQLLANPAGEQNPVYK